MSEDEWKRLTVKLSKSEERIVLMMREQMARERLVASNAIADKSRSTIDQLRAANEELVEKLEKAQWVNGHEENQALKAANQELQLQVDALIAEKGKADLQRNSVLARMRRAKAALE